MAKDNKKNIDTGQSSGSFSRRNIQSEGTFSRQRPTETNHTTPSENTFTTPPADNNIQSQNDSMQTTTVNLTKSYPGATTLNPVDRSVLSKETVITVGEEKPKKEKKKKSKLWIRIILLILIFLVFISACGLAVYAVSNIIANLDSDKTFTNIVIKNDKSLNYTINERVYSDYSNLEGYFSLNELSEKDLKFKWVNNSVKVLELQITFDKSQAMRFRHYNTYNSMYTTEKLLEVDFSAYTLNFEQKFILAEDGYYYFDTNSQSGNSITFVILIEYNLNDYHGQFDGVRIDEVFEFQQSADPDSDWGYYSYLFKK